MERTEEERICLCALARAYGYVPQKALAAIRAAGSATAAFRADTSGKLGGAAFDSAAMELEQARRAGCRFIGLGEAAYPALLAECADPPLGLYFKGDSPPEAVFSGLPAVAVVGTRNITPYGREWCTRIVQALARAPVRPLVVSGLAIGVDITAHRTALACGLPTVAVLPTGIDAVYPSRHVKDAERIAATPGCALVTDYPPGTPPVRMNFLRRNRIIAGLARATLLVESKVRGGGMMTSRLAASYDRDVFALPGRVDDPLSQGCNLLIRENLAEPVGDPAALAERLGLGAAPRREEPDFTAAVGRYYDREGYPEKERDLLVRLAARIRGRRGISLDELCAATRLPFSTVSRVVSMLEMDGFVSMDLLQHCSAHIKKEL